MKLSVIVPVYNEQRTIARVLEIIASVPIDKEIIVVDDGSTDGTDHLLRERFLGREGLKLIFHERNYGKGRAVRTGIGAAGGEALIIQDADLEYDPNDYAPLVKTLEAGHVNVVYGSRFMRRRHVTAAWHRLVNFFLTALTNKLFGSRLTDMETCYKLFKTSAIRAIQIESNGFEIEAEITAKLLLNGERIAEIPISYKGRSYHEGKKIGWRDGFKAVFTLFRCRFAGRA